MLTVAFCIKMPRLRHLVGAGADPWDRADVILTWSLTAPAAHPYRLMGISQQFCLCTNCKEACYMTLYCDVSKVRSTLRDATAILTA